jgi:hypothetical protein
MQNCFARRRVEAHAACLAAILFFPAVSPGQVVANSPATKNTAGQNASPVRVVSFQPGTPLVRAQRPVTLTAVVENSGDTPREVTPTLQLPAGVRLLSAASVTTLALDPHGQKSVSWSVEADGMTQANFLVELHENDQVVAQDNLDLEFLQPVPQQKLADIPDPQPVHTDLMIGALDCPLWEYLDPASLAHGGHASPPGATGTATWPWNAVVRHPERTPALGFYDQRNPEVADWEIKWALEHGISYFVYCWYRLGKTVPVRTKYAEAISDGLFKSRFGDQFKFAIMWTNQSKKSLGVKDENDLMQNLFPFWLKNYFQKPNYLKIGNKPLLFVYSPTTLIAELHGMPNVVHAFEAMRQASRAAGFDGLYLIGEYRGLEAKHLELMKQMGLDYTFAYCWNIPGSPAPPQAIATQMKDLETTRALHILPEVVTVSQGWSGWHDEGSIWKLPPPDYRSLLVQAKDFIATMPRDQLGSRLLLLDNWNEFGEGHYIAPHREFGFGYLDAVRSVFSDAPEPHVDLIPEDIGLGPYDSPPAK